MVIYRFMQHVARWHLFEANKNTGALTPIPAAPESVISYIIPAGLRYIKKTHTMKNIESIWEFLQEGEVINEAKAPFYDSAEAIKAILSSDMVAVKMKMQQISKITKMDGSKIAYMVSSSGPQVITISVTLGKVTTAGDKYGDNATYKVIEVLVVPTR